MGRHRSRSISYSPRRSRSPPRRRRHDPHEKRTGLLVRNVALNSRPEDLRIPFERFGPVKDVYLPKNYYTGEPRGFGFVKFRYPEDAAEAKDRLNYTVIGGREIRIVYAEENRKTPHEMRRRTRPSDRRGGSSQRRSLSRSPRRRNRSYSRSPSPARHYSRSVSASQSPRGRYSHSREASVHDERRYKSSRRSRSPKVTKEYRSSSRSPSRDASPFDEKAYRSSRRSQSPRDASHDKDYRAPRSQSLRDATPDKDYRSSRRSSGLVEEPLPDKSDFRSSRWSCSPRDTFHDSDYKSSRRSRGSKEESPLDEKEPRGSVSPRGFGPDDSRDNSKMGSLSPDPGDAEALRKPAPRSPRDISPSFERKGKSKIRSSPKHHSPDSERYYQSNRRSLTPAENGVQKGRVNGPDQSPSACNGHNISTSRSPS